MHKRMSIYASTSTILYKRRTFLDLGIHRGPDTNLLKRLRGNFIVLKAKEILQGDSVKDLEMGR